MKILLLTILMIGLAVSAPTSDVSPSSDTSKSKENKKIVITEEYFLKEFRIHTAEHDVVQILVPFNALNNGKRNNPVKTPIFFVEADEVNGVKEYKGVSIILSRNVTKLLETGKDLAVTDDNMSAYIAATDGIYQYNPIEQTVEKYGNINDNLIGIAKVKNVDIIFVLTKDNVLYKVTEDGTKKEEVDHVYGAKQIVLDYSNNLYYYGADKQPYVLNENGVKKIEGFSSNINEITLLKPPIVLENGIPAVIDNKAYILYANGTKADTVYEFQVKPTAYAMEAFYAQSYAYNKNIYLFDIVSILGYLAQRIHNQQ